MLAVPLKVRHVGGSRSSFGEKAVADGAALLPLTKSLSPATALPPAFAILIVALDSVVLPGSLMLGALVRSETLRAALQCFGGICDDVDAQRRGVEPQCVEHLYVDGRQALKCGARIKFIERDRSEPCTPLH